VLLGYHGVRPRPVFLTGIKLHGCATSARRRGLIISREAHEPRTIFVRRRCCNVFRHFSAVPALFSQTKAPAAILPEAFAGWSSAAQPNLAPIRAKSITPPPACSRRIASPILKWHLQADDRMITVKRRDSRCCRRYAAFTFFASLSCVRRHRNPGASLTNAYSSSPATYSSMSI